MTDIAANLVAVGNSIAAAAQKVGRNPKEVTLVAVGKAFPAEAARAALEAGHRVFGENRVQEAAEKWPRLKQDFPDVRLHLIGPLQRNKVKKAIGLFDVIETVGCPKLALCLAAEMEASGRRPECWVQVNTGEEPQKAGVAPDDADAFAAFCQDELNLPIQGLMCIPPAAEESSLHFALLHEIARRNGLTGLSMGMSHDFETAIAFGATHVRVGAAIFGKRP